MNKNHTYEKHIPHKTSMSWDARAVDIPEGKEGVLKMSAVQHHLRGGLAQVYGICFPFTLKTSGEAKYDPSLNFFCGSYQQLEKNYRGNIPQGLALERHKDRHFRYQEYKENVADKNLRRWFYLISPNEGCTLEETLQVGSSQASLIRSLRKEAQKIIPSLGEKLYLVKESIEPQESIEASFVDFPTSLLNRALHQKQFYKARNHKGREKNILGTLPEAQLISIPLGGQPR